MWAKYSSQACGPGTVVRQVGHVCTVAKQNGSGTVEGQDLSLYCHAEPNYWAQDEFSSIEYCAQKAPTCWPFKCG
jgi:hypothetical protein